MPDLESVLTRIDEFAWPQRAKKAAAAARRSVATDPQTVDEAVSELSIYVADQDVVGSLTAKCFPLLLELATQPDNPGGSVMLHWLLDIAIDGHLQWLSTGLDVELDSKRLFDGRTHANFRKCHRALVAQRDRLVGGLGHDDAQVRMASAYALAWTGGAKPAVREAVVEALETEKDPAAAASLCLCLGLLAREGEANLEHDIQVLETRQEDDDPDIAISAAWGLAKLRDPLSDATFGVMLDAYERGGDVRWGAGFPWDVRNPGELVHRLGREPLDADRKQRVVEVCLAHVATSRALAFPAGKQLVELAFGGQADLSSELTEEQRRILTVFAEQPWADEGVTLRDLGFGDLDAVRSALGLEPLGGVSELARSVEIGGRTETIATFWHEATHTDTPSRDEFVAALLGSGELDVWCCYVEGLHIDPPSFKMAGYPSPEKAICPTLLDRLIEGDAAAGWASLDSFARRAAEDRTALPRPLEDSKRLWPALVLAATRLAPHITDSTPLDAMDAVLREFDKAQKGKRAPAIENYLSALPESKRAQRVHMLLTQELDCRPPPDGRRYTYIATSPEIASMALDYMEAQVKDGRFGRMGAKTKKDRRALRDKSASTWAKSLDSSLVGRLLALASEPITFDKHDDRDVFATILARLAPGSIPALITLLEDKSKAIRTIADEGLKSCSPEQLGPHLGKLRSSKKKAHKNLLAALEKGG